MSRTIHVAACTGGAAVPGARFRIRQHISRLRPLGVRIEEFTSRIGQYPPKAVWLRPFWLAAGIGERGAHALLSHRYDLVIFQRELLSTLVTVERLFGRPRVLDVDDAIWLHRRGHFAALLAGLCDAVICGNSFLADYFSQTGRRTFVLPTAVDTQRFVPALDARPGPPIIGWSGTASNLAELERLEPSLIKVLDQHREVRLRVICDRSPRFQRLQPDRVEYIAWSPTVEVSALQSMTIGLMPLPDNDWSRGKCAYKMLTYMACGLPVVVSPVGMNSEVLAMGELGFGPRAPDEWVDALTTLLDEPDLTLRMGATGRAVIEAAFSVDALSARLAAILRLVAR